MGSAVAVLGFLSATLWGGTGLIEVPTAYCLEGGSVRGIASEVGERGTKVLALDVGFSDDLEVGAARWRLDERRKGAVVNLKVRLLHERRGLPSLAVGARDAGANVLSEPERYAILTKRLGRRADAHLGLLDGPGGAEAIGGLAYRLSLSTQILLEFRGDRLNAGVEFDVPLVGLFAKWAVLDLGRKKDLAVWVGWGL